MVVSGGLQRLTSESWCHQQIINNHWMKNQSQSKGETADIGSISSFETSSVSIYRYESIPTPTGVDEHPKSHEWSKWSTPNPECSLTLSDTGTQPLSPRLGPSLLQDRTSAAFLRPSLAQRQSLQMGWSFWVFIDHPDAAGVTLISRFVLSGLELDHHWPAIAIVTVVILHYSWSWTPSTWPLEFVRGEAVIIGGHPVSFTTETEVSVASGDPGTILTPQRWGDTVCGLSTHTFLKGTHAFGLFYFWTESYLALSMYIITSLLLQLDKRLVRIAAPAQQFETSWDPAPSKNRHPPR